MAKSLPNRVSVGSAFVCPLPSGFDQSNSIAERSIPKRFRLQWRNGNHASWRWMTSSGRFPAKCCAQAAVNPVFTKSSTAAATRVESLDGAVGGSLPTVVVLDVLDSVLILISFTFSNRSPFTFLDWSAPIGSAIWAGKWIGWGAVVGWLSSDTQRTP